MMGSACDRFLPSRKKVIPNTPNTKEAKSDPNEKSTPLEWSKEERMVKAEVLQF